MARSDFEAWVPVETGSEVLTRVRQVSAIERGARQEAMSTQIKEVPVSGGFEMAVDGKGDALTEDDSDADKVLLIARKIRSGVRVAEEDVRDSLPNIINVKTQDWATSYAKFLDNAALGTTAAANGTTVPFDSVYRVASEADRVEQTAGVVTYDALSGVLASYEGGDYYEDGATVVLAHPAFKAALRGVKDEQGLPIFVQGLAGTPDTIFGNSVLWTPGAKTSATASQSPDGNPILVVAHRDHLILGNRSNPEFRVDYQEITDEHVLQGRARKAFAVGDPTAVAVLEVTAGS